MSAFDVSSDKKVELPSSYQTFSPITPIYTSLAFATPDTDGGTATERRLHESALESTSTDDRQVGDMHHAISLDPQSPQDRPSSPRRRHTPSYFSTPTASAPSFWPGAHQLRRLFKVFDRDGDGSISISEFRHGLQMLGFNVDSIAGLKLLQSSMTDGGSITESQFIHSFRTLNRQEIERKLSQQGGNMRGSSKSLVPSPTEHMSLSLTEIGTTTSSNGNLTTCVVVQRKLSFSQLVSKMDDTSAPSSADIPWRKRIRWVDIVGLNSDVLNFLNNFYNLPLECLENVDMEQTASCDYYPDASLLRLVLHRFHFSHPPFTNTHDLVTKQAYIAHRPVLLAIPVHILVTGDTVITIRPYCEGVDEVNDMWAEMCSSLLDAVNTSTLSPTVLSLSSATSLFISLLDEINEQNWLLRDYYKDWVELLNTHLRSNYLDAYYLMHIVDLENIANMTTRYVKPYLETLGDLIHRPNSNSNSNSSSNSSNNVQLSSSSYNNGSAVDENKIQRNAFVRDVLPDLRSVQKSTRRFQEQALYSANVVHSLRAFYSQRRDEQTNYTLYILTVVTTIVTPLQILSSVYGMNFDNLPELHYEYGYYTFLVVNVAFIILIALWFRSRRLL